MLRWVSSLSDVTDCTRRDWAGTLQTYGLVWGLPIAAIVAGLFLNVGLRTAIWTIALGWMGAACLLIVATRKSLGFVPIRLSL